jgi:hypothetical protein
MNCEQIEKIHMNKNLVDYSYDYSIKNEERTNESCSIVP